MTAMIRYFDTRALINKRGAAIERKAANGSTTTNMIGKYYLISRNRYPVLPATPFFLLPYQSIFFLSVSLRLVASLHFVLGHYFHPIPIDGAGCRIHHASVSFFSLHSCKRCRCLQNLPLYKWYRYLFLCYDFYPRVSIPSYWKQRA